MSESMLTKWSSVLGLSATLFLCPLGIAEVAAQQDEPALTAGQQEFQMSCSPCHGLEGKGNGPIVKLLKEKPADLTQITKKNNGEFPFWETYQMIDGRRPMDGHGGREMPIWGDRFKAEATGTSSHGSDAVVRGRILELIVYLQSIQEE